MNAEAKRRTIDILLRKRVRRVTIELPEELNGAAVTALVEIEVREQPISRVQPIIDRIGAVSAQQTAFDLMAVSCFVDGDPLPVNELSPEIIQALAPVSAIVMDVHGFETPAAPAAKDDADEKKDPPAADDSQASFDPNSS